MNTDVLEKIKSRGHWHVTIRPTKFSEKRIETLNRCEQLIERNCVRSHGWDFPYLERQNLLRKLDHIEHSVAFRSINETWRFYTSGQFAYFGGLIEDWFENDSESTARSSTSPEPGIILDVLHVLYRLSEVYEFAARLAQQGVFADTVLLKINLVRMENRRLWSPTATERWAWGIESGRHKCSVSELPREQTFAVEDLVAQSRELSFEHFSWVMDCFGFEPAGVIFKREQEKFFSGI